MAEITWITKWRVVGAGNPPPRRPHKTVTYYTAMIEPALPPIMAKELELSRFELALVPQPIQVRRAITTIAKEKSEIYTINYLAKFMSADCDICAHLPFSGQFSDLDSLVVGITPGDYYRFVYVGNPIPGGRGQRKALEAFGRRVYQQFGQLMQHAQSCAEIDYYMTRRANKMGEECALATRRYYKAAFEPGGCLYG